MPKLTVEKLFEMYSQEGLSEEKQKRLNQAKRIAVDDSARSYGHYLDFKLSNESKTLDEMLKSTQSLEVKWAALTAYMQEAKNVGKELYIIIHQKLINALPQAVEELLEIYSQEKLSEEKKTRQDQVKRMVIDNSEQSYGLYLHHKLSNECKTLYEVLKSTQSLEVKWVALTTYLQEAKNVEKELYTIIHQQLINALPQDEASYRLHFFKRSVVNCFNASRDRGEDGDAVLAAGVGATIGLIDVVTRKPLSIESQAEALDLVDKLSMNTNQVNRSVLIKNIIDSYSENSRVIGRSKSSKELLAVLENRILDVDVKIERIIDYMRVRDDSGHLTNCGKNLFNIIIEELKKMENQEIPVFADNQVFTL